MNAKGRFDPEELLADARGGCAESFGKVRELNRTDLQAVKPIFKLFRIFRIHPTPPLGPSTAGALVNRLPASPSSADVSRASSSAIDR